MNVAIIPARGGSKRIPGKNIRLFCGRPMIAYSIEAAISSGVFDRIIVSTDCDNIAKIAEAAGAEVPFRRPPELSHDTTPTVPVIRHAIEWLRTQSGTSIGTTTSIGRRSAATGPATAASCGRTSNDRSPDVSLALSPQPSTQSEPPLVTEANVWQAKPHQSTPDHEAELAPSNTCLQPNRPTCDSRQTNRDDATTATPVEAEIVNSTTRGHAPSSGLPTFVCCVYATAPLIQSSDLESAWQRIQQDPDLEFVFTGTTFQYPIFRAFELLGAEQSSPRVSMLWPEHETRRSQDLPTAYHDAGQFYWGRTQAWEQHESVFKARSSVVLLPTFRVQDIDTPEDWTRAEWLYRQLHDESQTQRCRQ